MKKLLIIIVALLVVGTTVSVIISAQNKTHCKSNFKDNLGDKGK